MKDIKDIDAQLKDKNATEVKYLNEEGNMVSIPIKDVWAGPKSQEDLEVLTNILMSNKYWINGELVGGQANIRRKSFKNLEIAYLNK